MQVSWRKNPKTEDGWFKRTAISLLVALAVFLVSSPIAFLLFLNHLQSAYPHDTQNFLGAITGAVASGLALGGLGFGACMAVFLLMGLRGRPTQA